MRKSPVLLLALLAVALLTGLGLWYRSHATLVAEAQARLRAGRAFADSIAAVAGGTTAAARAMPITVQGAIAATYLERARIGLGSPFRLMAFAQADPRLSPAMRDDVAWALMTRTLDGAGYQIDDRALRAIPANDGDPAAHFALIERTIRRAHDPREGELVVRLAYLMAADEGLVSGRGALVASQVAALVRDRTLAQHDAQVLLRDARREHSDALTLLPEYRAARRFAVEQPALAPLGEALEDDAARSAPALLAQIRAIPSATDSMHTDDAAPVLSARTGMIVVGLPGVRDIPPSAPVVVEMRAHRGLMLSWARDAAMRAARARAIDGARTEESLAAWNAVLDGEHAAGTSTALAMLSVAVTLRASAQEAPWFPGDASPTAAVIAARYGLDSIMFDRNVPESWQPYYLRMLARSIDDARRVLPTLSVAGLRVRFGESALRDTALAVHDPRSRTIILPPATSAGAIGHELLHDLDWQNARKLYAVRGYGTDRAAQVGRGQLAASVQGLTFPRSTNALAPSDVSVHGWSASRPAEALAVNGDWFLAATLAREGRSDGYLSAVQDEMFTGYASARAPDATGSAQRALIDVLAGMTTLVQGARSDFLARYGSTSVMGPLGVLRFAESVESAANVQPASDVGTGAPAAWDSLAAWVASVAPRGCLYGCALMADESGEHASAMRTLLFAAVDARARGMVRARGAAHDATPSEIGAARALDGGPWNADLARDAVARARAQLFARLRAAVTLPAARVPVA